MIIGNEVRISFVIISNVAMYVTLPLHCRLLYVLARPSKKVMLDQSFRTLMMHTTIGNLLFALVHCTVTAPADVGLFYDFYIAISPFISHVDMIKAGPLLNYSSCSHVVLAATRFTAIAFPLKHPKIWARVSYLCVVLWIITFLISVPLMIPGSTGHQTLISVFGLPNVQYIYHGNYYKIYSMYGSFFAIAIELLTISIHIAMISKFRQFQRFTKSKTADVRKMTIGVVRTTIAAVMTSLGAWIAVAFIIVLYSYAYTTGSQLMDGVEFSAIFGLLNAIYNVSTPWVLLATFPNVRTMLFFNVPCGKTPRVRMNDSLQGPNTPK